MKTAKLMGVCLCCVLLPVACSKTASSATGGDLPTQSESTSSQPAMDASLKLFGVQLKGAERKTFRVALQNEGWKVIRDGDWVEPPQPKGSLEGAKTLEERQGVGEG